MRLFLVIACLTSFALIGAASDKWAHKNPQQVLNDSPWAKVDHAFIGTTDEDARTYPAQPLSARDAGIATRGTTDGNWDGGVAAHPRGTDPTLPVLVRWDSSRTVREALLRAHDPNSTDTEHSLDEPEKYYIVSVTGVGSATKHGTTDPAEDAYKRQGLVGEARLLRPDKPAIRAVDARWDPATGFIRIYFPKTDPITASDREVVFRLKYGDVQVNQPFRLKDMLRNGQPDL